MKMSETEAYTRFPVIPLTAETAAEAGHIDMFESADPEYAVKRMIDGVWNSVSDEFNVVVWIPTCARYSADASVIAAANERRGANDRWLLDMWSSQWGGAIVKDAGAYTPNGLSVSPDEIFSQGVAGQMEQMRNLLMAQKNIIGIKSELNLDKTHTHFACSDDAIGVAMPHIDSLSGGRKMCRLLEMFHGAGTYIVPNDAWTSVVAEPDLRQTVTWADAEAPVITPLLQIPDNAVIAFTTGASAKGKPVLHGAAINPLVEGKPVATDRLHAIYTMI